MWQEITKSVFFVAFRTANANQDSHFVRHKDPYFLTDNSLNMLLRIFYKRLKSAVFLDFSINSMSWSLCIHSEIWVSPVNLPESCFLCCSHPVFNYTLFPFLVKATKPSAEGDSWWWATSGNGQTQVPFSKLKQFKQQLFLFFVVLFFSLFLFLLFVIFVIFVLLNTIA